LNFFEIGLFAFALLGILMRIFLIPGGGFIIGISLSTLAILYYPLGIFSLNAIPIHKVFKKQTYKELTATRIIGTVLGGIVFSILIVGIMFRMLIIPGDYFMLGTGLSAGLIFLIVFLILYLKKRENQFLRTMMIRTIIILAISGFLISIPTLNFVKFFYRDKPDHIEYFEKEGRFPSNLEPEPNTR
jgi:hypothetical protein